LGIGSQPILEVTLHGIDKRKHVQLKDKNNQAFKAPLYTVSTIIFGKNSKMLGR